MKRFSILVHVINLLVMMMCFCRFIEYGEYKENLYGTSLDSIHRVLDQNKVCLVDVQPEVSVFKNMVGGTANQIHFSFKSNFLCVNVKVSSSLKEVKTAGCILATSCHIHV